MKWDAVIAYLCALGAVVAQLRHAPTWIPVVLLLSVAVIQAWTLARR
jgi:hypothetical protein